MATSIDSVSSTYSTTDSTQLTQARQDALAAAAKELGMSSTDLRSELASGESLTDIANSKGVSPQDLQSTMEAAMKKDLPNASASQLSTMTSRMMAHHGHHAHGSSGASASSSASDASGSTSGAGSSDGNQPLDSTSTMHVVV